MRDHGGDVEFAVDKLNAELHIVLVVLTYHHSGLVEAHLVVAAHLYLCLKLPTVCGIEEGAVVHGKSIVGNAPIVGLGRYVHFKRTFVNGVGFGFVEPLHLLKRLGLGRQMECGDGCGEQHFHLHKEQCFSGRGGVLSEVGPGRGCPCRAAGLLSARPLH